MDLKTGDVSLDAIAVDTCVSLNAISIFMA